MKYGVWDLNHLKISVERRYTICILLQQLLHAYLALLTILSCYRDHVHAMYIQTSLEV